MKHKNTLQKGSVRILVFREKGDWYAAALEFNIVESGDTPREAMLLLLEAIQGYLESAKKIRARTHILNQKPDAEYEQRWQENIESRKQDKDVYFAGRVNVPGGQRFLSA